MSQAEEMLKAMVGALSSNDFGQNEELRFVANDGLKYYSVVNCASEVLQRVSHQSNLDCLTSGASALAPAAGSRPPMVVDLQIECAQTPPASSFELPVFHDIPPPPPPQNAYQR